MAYTIPFKIEISEELKKELASKYDIALLKQELDSKIELTRQDFKPDP